MRFFHILPAVLALLQREGRVMYKALKDEFGFNEAFLEKVSGELQSCSMSCVSANPRSAAKTTLHRKGSHTAP